MKKEQNFAKALNKLSSANKNEEVFDYLIEGMELLSFSVVLVLEEQQEGSEHFLKGVNSLGFEEEFKANQIEIPLKHEGGVFSKSFFSNELLALKNQEIEESSIDTTTKLKDYNLLVAPLVKKGGDNRFGIIMAGKKDELKEIEKTYFHTICYQAGLALEKNYLKKDIKTQKRELNQRIYELSILQDLSQRIGYSLDAEKIATIIINSLSKLLDFHAVSYTLLKEKEVVFNCHLEKRINNDFLDTMEAKNLESLNTLLDANFAPKDTQEEISGTIVDDTTSGELESFFNVPFIINDQPVGVLTVASTKKGLYQEDEMSILYKITDLASNAVSKLQNLIETEKRKLKDMVESMGDGVIMVDRNLALETINSRGQQYLNIKRKNLTTFEIIEALPDSVDLKSKIETSIEKKESTKVEEIKLNDRYLRIIITPALTETLKEEKVLGAVVVIHDVSKEKELQKMRKEFVSMMVHELRSPLDGIRKIAELLQNEKTRQDEETLDKFLNLIHEEVQKLLKLVGDLLDIEKLESGQIQIELEENSLEEILENRFQYYRPQIEDKNLTFSKNFGPNLPETLHFDKEKLKQVLDNLLSNAIKFNKKEGEVKIQAFRHNKGVSLTEEAKKHDIDWFLKDEEKFSQLGEAVVIAVTHSGPGIAPENQEKLFEKFQQFKASKESDKRGTGLGLAICKEIVKAHQGKIDVASKGGEGSTFYLTIPLKLSKND